MFKPDCLEVVLTIENTSDSKFYWKEQPTLKPKHSLPLPNTLVSKG